jgi:hypothetical protein
MRLVAPGLLQAPPATGALEDSGSKPPASKPPRRGTSLNIFTRFLNGAGGIESVINSTGAAVKSANKGPSDRVSYSQAAHRAWAEPRNDERRKRSAQLDEARPHSRPR